MRKPLLAMLFLTVVPMLGHGEFTIDAAGKDKPSCEVVFQGSGSQEIEICVTNNGPAEMTVLTKCQQGDDLTLTIGEGETKCQCCSITEVRVCIPKGSRETTGSYSTGSCTAPVK